MARKRRQPTISRQGSISPGYSLEIVTDPEAAAAAEPLFREFGAWVRARLATDCGLPFGLDDLERHHVAFRAEFPKMLHPPGRLALGRVDGVPVGVAALKPVGPGIGEIKRMFVAPAARGTGLGQAILELLLAEARTEGYTLVRLESLRFMTDAHRLYRAVGFVESVAFAGAEAEMSGLGEVTYFFELPL